MLQNAQIPWELVIILIITNLLRFIGIVKSFSILQLFNARCLEKLKFRLILLNYRPTGETL